MTRLDSLPASPARTMRIATEIARRDGSPVFLVGGPVRDLLLGRVVRDLDFMMEGDPEPFVRELASRIGAEVRTFERFMTYKIGRGDQHLLDVATARTETYSRPGSLPTVARADAAQDLARRDFAINAMAMDLRDESILDPLGGQADIVSGTIRILHRRSFEDDPTRILRGLRFASRFGFTMDPATEDRMSEAIGRNVFASVSRERLWREIYLAFREELVPAAVEMTARHGGLRHLLGIDSLDSSFVERLSRLIEDHNPASLDRDVLFLAVVLRNREPGARVEGSGLGRDRLETLKRLIFEEDDFILRLVNAPGPRAQFVMCEREPPELLALASTDDRRARDIIEAFRQYQAMDIGVRGDELELPSGPHIAHGLREARFARWEGTIAAADERGFARTAALQYLSDANKSNRT